MITVNNLNFSYQKHSVLHNISINSIRKGETVAVIGPNGTGKSTLFKCIAGIQKIARKTIYLNGQDITRLSRGVLASRICYMPQDNACDAALTVFEVVLLAKKFTSQVSVDKKDIAQVALLLENLKIDHLSDRYISELSGGQRQLVSLAQALIRNPEILLLDEPTASLDLHHQMEALALVQYLTQVTKRICFLAMHDLNLAARYADMIIILHAGKIVSIGKPGAVLNEKMLAEIYKIKASVVNETNHLYIHPQKSLTQSEVQLKNIERVIYQQN